MRRAGWGRSAGRSVCGAPAAPVGWGGSPGFRPAPTRAGSSRATAWSPSSRPPRTARQDGPSRQRWPAAAERVSGMQEMPEPTLPWGSWATARGTTPAGTARAAGPRQDRPRTRRPRPPRSPGAASGERDPGGHPQAAAGRSVPPQDGAPRRLARGPMRPWPAGPRPARPWPEPPSPAAPCPPERGRVAPGPVAVRPMPRRGRRQVVPPPGPPGLSRRPGRPQGPPPRERCRAPAGWTTWWAPRSWRQPAPPPSYDPAASPSSATTVCRRSP